MGPPVAPWAMYGSNTHSASNTPSKMFPSQIVWLVCFTMARMLHDGSACPRGSQRAAGNWAASQLDLNLRRPGELPACSGVRRQCTYLLVRLQLGLHLHRRSCCRRNLSSCKGDHSAHTQAAQGQCQLKCRRCKQQPCWVQQAACKLQQLGCCWLRFSIQLQMSASCLHTCRD